MTMIKDDDIADELDGGAVWCDRWIKKTKAIAG
jgi:hypothetical protein